MANSPSFEEMEEIERNADSSSDVNSASKLSFIFRLENIDDSLYLTAVNNIVQLAIE